MIKRQYFLFDMDGVLLDLIGYRKALQTSVNRIAVGLGAPHTFLSENQIAKFEALHVTNEWDTLAICTALVLVAVWQIDSQIRINSLHPVKTILSTQPDFNYLLDQFTIDNSLPGDKALNIILGMYPELCEDQRNYLTYILSSCRDIYSSPILPIHQEIILGSQVFHDYYNLKPIYNEESFLLKFDRPKLKPETLSLILNLLKLPINAGCVMTNRPSKTPPGYLSSPEAELGLKCAGIETFPYISSGILRWFSHVILNKPNLSLLKPNPIHALASLRMCLGELVLDAIEKSFLMIQGKSKKADWSRFNQSKIVVFEDSTKGLLSAKAAQELLQAFGITTDLDLVGVSSNPIKTEALGKITSKIIDDINNINWETYQHYHKDL